jgi:SAM-dependent methyltransferase
MGWLDLIPIVMLICFTGVLLVGAPYLPTLTPQVKTALELVDLKPGDCLLELGCGDGKVLIAAARAGIKSVGYELNPVMALVAWLRTWRHRKLVTVIWGNFWSAPWPPADGVFVFLLPKFMPKLNKKILQYSHKPVKLVSFAFAVPGKTPVRQKDGVQLYVYD